MIRKMAALLCLCVVVTTTASCTNNGAPDTVASGSESTVSEPSRGQTESTTELTEEEIVKTTLELLEQGNTVFWWYHSGFPEDMEIDTDAAPVEETYYPVGKFQTLQEMKEATERVYTVRFCDKILYPYGTGFGEDIDGSAHFKEFDGRLYYNDNMGGMGGATSTTDQVTIKSQNADEIVVTVICEQLVERDISKQVPYDFKLIKENGSWKLDNWYEYNSEQNFAEYRKQYLANMFFAHLLDRSWESAAELDPDRLVTYAIYCNAEQANNWFDRSDEFDKTADNDILVPADDMEEYILPYFDIDADYLHKSQFYDPDKNTYMIFGLGGVSECTVNSAEHNLKYLLIRYNSYQDAMLLGDGLLRIVENEDGSYQYHSNEFYANKEAPREPVDVVINSANYDPAAGLFSVTIPEEIPAGYKLYLHVSGSIAMGDSGQMPFHSFEAESESSNWEAGKTYTYELQADSLKEIVVTAGLQADGSIAMLNEIEMYLDADGNKQFASSMQAMASTAEESEEISFSDYKPGDDAYYLELVNRKAELIGLVRKRADGYRNGTPPDVPEHHPEYPSDFPPVSELPEILSADNFAVRFAGNPDALGSVYLAVPIGDSGEYELHMTASKGIVDGRLQWMSGDTFFEKVSELKWHKQDIDLYSSGALFK